ncbi:MAG: acetyl-CoA carboxylase biotin carboxyl carrier protein subunit [Bacteroidales bacterium]|nr:acetyl-CoA carboxylase biotin carboxyl carrier protein subunit [Bacteroidales bacterium]
MQEILSIGETEYITTLTEKFKNRKPWQKPIYNRVVSQIPGTISKILVNENQHVTVGEPLFVFEAMKMRNIICAQIDGYIKSIDVVEGQEVAKHFTLAEIDNSLQINKSNIKN